jgi:hypothetical protein
VQVIEGADVQEEANEVKEGKCINSDFLNGLDVKAAIKRAIAEVEKRKYRKRKSKLPPARRGIWPPTLLGRTHSHLLQKWNSVYLERKRIAPGITGGR